MSLKSRAHAADLATSPRLQRVYDLLKRGGEWSTREIIEAADVCCPNTVVFELRENGINVQCTRHKRKGKSALYKYSIPGAGKRDSQPREQLPLAV